MKLSVLDSFLPSGVQMAPVVLQLVELDRDVGGGVGFDGDAPRDVGGCSVQEPLLKPLCFVGHGFGHPFAGLNQRWFFAYQRGYLHNRCGVRPSGL